MDYRLEKNIFNVYNEFNDISENIGSLRHSHSKMKIILIMFVKNVSQIIFLLH